ncbi:MAG: RDD family protein [Armatimonadetes bacterium]|nr:RDD family protein [Armatimonadota bacterium]
MQRDRVIIETPEHVQFSYELAGLGSRFLALVLDTLIQGAGLLVVLILLSAANQLLNWTLPDLGEAAGLPITMVILVFSMTLLVLAYFIVFELIWNGQTPGKRIGGMRVIRAGGGSIGFAASAIRNILRFVDSLPIFYLFGGIFAFFTRASQRIGDLAAGTIVVKERLWEYPGEDEAAEPGEEPGDLAEVGDLAVRRARGYVSSLSPEQIRTVCRFIERRNELSADMRNQLATRIAATLREQFPGLSLAEGEEPERFVEIVYQAHLQRERNL